MDYYKGEWLAHLKGAIPDEARRNRISLYTIALEGWRRGLTLKFHITKDADNQKHLIYSLRHEHKVHFFNESSGDKNTEKAFKICHDKGLTNKCLEKANIPIPLGKTFGIDSTVEDILRDSKNLPFPLVVKPTDGDSGKGVIVNIQDQHALKKAINHVRHELKYENIIVQSYVEGDEVRLYVLDDKVLAAVNRRPANIVGDGRSPISKLIEQKNEFRKHSPHLHYRPIRIDTEVRRLISDAGYTLDSVINAGERLYLRKISNISTGGEPIDVTDQLTHQQKQIAIQAAKAIPGLAHCGVDMIISKESGVILELNTRPGIGLHLFPVEGKARDIPKAIIDYYFPETKGEDITHSNVYFDLQTVFDAIHGGYVSEVDIKQHPKNKLHTKKFMLTGELDVVSYYERLKKYIVQHNFNGYIKTTKNKTIELVLGHETIGEVENFKTYLHDRRKNLQIHDVTVTDWDEPIKRCFELIDGYEQLSLIELETENQQLYRQLRTIEIEVNRLVRRVKVMKESSSWKMTAPIRLMKDLVRKLR